MSAPKVSDAIRITCTGVERPGITAEIASILADAAATLVDVEQVVVEEKLSLSFVVSLPEDRARSVLKDVLWRARELGLSVDFDFDPRDGSRLARATWALTVLGNPIGTELLARLSRITASTGFNIERIQRLSSEALVSAEFLLSGDEHAGEKELRALR